MFTKTKLLIPTIFTIFILVAAQCGVAEPESAIQQSESAEVHEEEHHEDEIHAEEEHAHEAHEHEAEMPELMAASLAGGEKLKVLATTSIVGDIVNNVGGEAVELTVLLPLGTDPHSFSPAPADLASVADAHVIFANGMGLEEFLDEMIENAGGEAAIVHVSHGIEPREFEAGQGHEHEGEEHEGEEHEGEHHHHEGADPHTWMTPANATIFVHNIEHALSELDPAHAEAYSTNAETYEAKLAELDTWVKAQINSIPADNRELVADHITFGYYTDRYGLEMIGAVLPSVSTNAEPSAQDLAKLQDAISEYGVKAVFVGTSVNPVLAERMAEDTGTQLVPLYTGSLGEPGSGAETYVDYIRYNTRAIVDALK